MRAWVWWLRSPFVSGATNFCFVSNGGGATNSNASNSCGLALGFSI